MAATYTVRQVAQILGYSTNSIYTFLKEKRIKGVRVGKGRFRIPQSELDRLLLTKKSSVAQPLQQTDFQPRTNATALPFAGVSDVTGSAVIEHIKFLGFVHLGTLNMFDWFIGTGAVVSGFGLFLFNASLAFLGDISPGLRTIRILLIGCGIGILVTNLIGQTHTAWHKIFHVLLGILGLVLAGIFFRGGDVDGVIIYGGISALVILSTFIHVGGVAWVSVYMSLLAVAVPITFLLSGKNVHIQTALATLPFSQTIVVLLAALFGALFIFGLEYGYRRSKTLFWLTTWASALWFFVVAFWYAGAMYWARSFLLLTLGMTSLYLYPWQWLAGVKSRKADLFTLGVFAFIFAIILVGIAGVYLIQTNEIATVERENVYKAQFAKQSVEQTLGLVMATVSGVSDNVDFASAITAKDTTALTSSERIMFESNRAIRRLVVLDANGQAINLYPAGTFDETDLSGRDYFKAARDQGIPMITDLFMSADVMHRQVVNVASPLYDKNHTFIGVIAASLDLLSMSANLQKIAVPQRSEYVIVVDSHGKRLADSDPARIGTPISPSDPLTLALHGQSGSVLGTVDANIRAVVAYEPVAAGTTHWGVAIVSPIANIYELSETTTIALFLIILAAVLIVGFVLQGSFFYKWHVPMTEGGP